MTTYFVPGTPRPKARPRVVNGHAYTPERTREWEDAVRMLYQGPTYEGDLTMTLYFYMPNRRRVDIDNLVKAVFDGLNGKAYHDDGQIVALHATKAIGKNEPGVWISVDAGCDDLFRQARIVTAMVTERDHSKKQRKIP